MTHAHDCATTASLAEAHALGREGGPAAPKRTLRREGGPAAPKRTLRREGGPPSVLPGPQQA